MELRKAVFSNEEAAVDDLAKDYFWDKILTSKDLFEIDDGLQNGQKWGKKAVKSGEKKNFHFGDLDVKKWENHPFLRQPWAASPQHCQCVVRKLGNSCKGRSSRGTRNTIAYEELRYEKFRKF